MGIEQARAFPVNVYAQNLRLLHNYFADQQPQRMEVTGSPMLVMGMQKYEQKEGKEIWPATSAAPTPAP